MDISQITDFFMWCTIINVVMLFLSTGMCIIAGDWVYGMQKKFFPLKRETFDVVMYAFLGVFKILIIVFCVVPYIALLIIQ